MPTAGRINQQLIADCDWADPLSIGQASNELWLDNGYKERLEEIATRNRHLLFGNHWYVKNRLTSEWEIDRTRPGWRARLVFNDILVTVEQRLAKYQRDNRVWSPAQAGNQPADTVRQRIQAKVLEYYWTGPLRMRAKVAHALQWAMSSAAVFAHVFWDAKAGPLVTTRLQDWLYGADGIADPQQREDYLRQQTNRFFQLYGQAALQQGFYSGRSGDAAVEVAPLYEIDWWPHRVTDFAPSQVIAWQRTVCKPAVQVAEMLNLPVDEIRHLATGQGGGRFDLGRAGNSAWRELYYYGPQERIENDDRVLVRMIYRNPSDRWPMGRQALVIGTTTVWGPADLDFGKVQIYPLVEKPIRGECTGTCLVDQMQSAQEDLNSALSQAADYRNSRVAPMVVEIAGNLKGKGQKLSTKPGGTYPAIDQQHVPQAFQMPDVPVDFFRFAESHRTWMSRLGGVASIDMGETRDASVRSGRAINYLQTANDLRLIPFGTAIDDWAGEIGDNVLRYAQRIPTERIAYVMDDENRTEIVRFRGQDLRDEQFDPLGPEHRLVRVKTFSVIPRTPQEMTSFVSMALTPDATGRSLLDPEQNRDQILEMLGLNQFRKAFDRNRHDAINLSKDIEIWEAGGLAPDPEEQDNSMYYVEAIMAWMKTDGYRLALSKIDPRLGISTAAISVMSHLNSHKQNIARKAVEGQYLAIEAHVSEWLKARATILKSLSEGADPQMAMTLVNLLLPLPLVPIALPQTNESEAPPKGGKKPKKTDQSYNQGVPKSQQS